MPISTSVLLEIDKARRSKSPYLNLGNNNLTSLPASLTRLTHLTRLHLGSNRLLTLPKSTENLVNLRSLDIGINGMTKLPEIVTTLTHLASLNLNGNKLTTLPDSITNLIHLTDLFLGGNSGFTQLPESLFKLVNLRNLDISNTNLTILPNSISMLGNLASLYLGNNQLTTLPDSIADITSLTNLDLSGNRLTALPENLTKLTNIAVLNLADNNLTTLPESITKLTHLKYLDLSGNNLTALPQNLGELAHLKYLNLRNNRLNLPFEILNTTDAPAILSHLRQSHTVPSDNRPMNEAKIILVGEAGVGKTSLVKRLMHNRFRLHEPQTDGIDIHRWKLSGIHCISHDGETDASSRTVDLNIWDMGGQEINHATHQFFLTERTLYLLVLSARLTDEQNRLHYWLKTIRALGKDAPILIVHNQYETNPEQLDRKTLRKEYPSITTTGFVETSCARKTVKGIDTLKEAIRQEIGKMPHVSDPLPPSCFAVKERLEKETLTHDFVSLEEYEKLCAEAGIDAPEERKGILSLLHALGTVIGFQDDVRLRDTNVLNPQWVTEGVYAVLDDPELKKAANGLLSENALPKILADKQWHPPSKYAYILDMMTKFELCFALPGQTGEYLVPELLAPIEPDSLGDFTDALNFELQYDFLPRSILPRFIVGTHNMLQTYRWRKGVVIEHAGCQALIRADTDNGIVRIAVAGNEATRRDILSILRNEFARIHQTPETLVVKELVPLVEHPKADPVPYTFLRQLEDEKQEQFHWPGVTGPLSVSELLNGIERTRHNDTKKSAPPMPSSTPKPTISLDALLEETRVLPVADDNNRYLRELAAQVQKGRVVPFVGAGMTIALKLPGWGAALESIFDSAKSTMPPDDIVRYATAKALNQWEEAAQALWDASNLGERGFNDRIKSLFGHHRLPDPITGAIALLPRFAQGAILTTNFDAALEHVYAAAGQSFSSEDTILGDYRADSVISKWDDSKRLLLKLHGDADESAGRILTKDQYDRAYGKASKLPELLRALFGSRRPLLFLGCSLLTDRTLIELKTAGLHQSNSYHFALLESPATADARQARQTTLVSQYGIQPIWFALGDFAAIERILTFLAEIAPP